MYWEYYVMGIILLPGLILSIWASIKVENTFKKYKQVTGAKFLTGAEVARRILNVNAINAQVTNIKGQLTDHYNPKTKVIALSNEVYSGTSISSLAVAAHECCHAIQDKENYAPLKFRNFVVTANNIGSKILWPIIFIGLIFGVLANTVFGKIVLACGIIFFGLSVLFSLITLPVEIDASKRAIKQLIDVGALDSMEVIGCKEVLKAAAWTYVAALVMSILELLRFLLIFADRD